VIAGLSWLLLFQVLGEVVVRLSGLPVPGPVMGMVLLFVALQVRRPVEGASVYVAGDGLLRHLQLLFVPAGVGVVGYLAFLREEALPLGVALVVSWLAGMLAVAGVMTLLARVFRTPSWSDAS
jgi:holin-like protein